MNLEKQSPLEKKSESRGSALLIIACIKTGNEAVTSWCPWEIYIMGENPPMMRKSLQPDLIAEAFSFMPLCCSGSGSSYCQCHKRGVTSPLACGRNPVSQKLPLQSAFVFWWLVFNSFFWLLFTAISYAYLLMRSVLTSEYGFQGKCSAARGAQHRLAARTGAVPFPLCGEWTSSITETQVLHFCAQFQVIYSPIPVPPRSVLYIRCPCSVFLMSGTLNSSLPHSMCPPQLSLST